jgi:hypothetical protein
VPLLGTRGRFRFHRGRYTHTPSNVTTRWRISSMTNLVSVTQPFDVTFANPLFAKFFSIRSTQRLRGSAALARKLP